MTECVKPIGTQGILMELILDVFKLLDHVKMRGLDFEIGFVLLLLLILLYSFRRQSFPSKGLMESHELTTIAFRACRE